VDLEVPADEVLLAEEPVPVTETCEVLLRPSWVPEAAGEEPPEVELWPEADSEADAPDVPEAEALPLALPLAEALPLALPLAEALPLALPLAEALPLFETRAPASVGAGTAAAGVASVAVPHGVAAPSGCVLSGAGTVVPSAPAITKRVDHNLFGANNPMQHLTSMHPSSRPHSFLTHAS
jgi:hypothetical protein